MLFFIKSLAYYEVAEIINSVKLFSKFCHRHSELIVVLLSLSLLFFIFGRRVAKTANQNKI